MTVILTDPERDRAAALVALFSVLVHSWQTNDFQRAADARRELGDLGVTVRMPRRPSRGKGVSRAD
jgi:hypothetical protein